MNRCYYGFISFQKQEGFNRYFTAKVGSMNFTSYNFGEVIEWCDYQIGKLVKVELIGEAYRVYTEEEKSGRDTELRNTVEL